MFSVLRGAVFAFCSARVFRFRLRVGQAFLRWQRSCPAPGDWTWRSRDTEKKKEEKDEDPHGEGRFVKHGRERGRVFEQKHRAEREPDLHAGERDHDRLKLVEHIEPELIALDLRRSLDGGQQHLRRGRSDRDRDQVAQLATPAVATADSQSKSTIAVVQSGTLQPALFSRRWHNGPPKAGCNATKGEACAAATRL